MVQIVYHVLPILHTQQQNLANVGALRELNRVQLLQISLVHSINNSQNFSVDEVVVMDSSERRCNYDRILAVPSHGQDRLILQRYSAHELGRNLVKYEHLILS